jgi:hypothetical protein
MRKATREALTLAISANAAAVAQRAVANMFPEMKPWGIEEVAETEAVFREQDANRYWLHLANTLKGRT